MRRVTRVSADLFFDSRSPALCLGHVVQPALDLLELVVQRVVDETGVTHPDTRVPREDLLYEDWTSDSRNTSMAATGVIITSGMCRSVDF